MKMPTNEGEEHDELLGEEFVDEPTDLDNGPDNGDGDE